MLKKFGLLVLVMMAALVVVSAAMAADEAMAPAATETAVVPATTDAAVAVPVAVNNAVCPVCGTAIEKAGENTVEVNGKVYETCCVSCKEEFSKDQTKFVAKVEEAMKAVEVPVAPAETK